MCDCIEKANKAMLEHNTVIEQAEAMNLKTGECRPALLVPTVRINSKSRKGPLRLIAKYCPMCGKKAA